MPWAVELVPEVDSTNRVLVERARAGAPEGAVLVADHQTAGRGRLGRSWQAPSGSSLLVSVLLRPGLPASRLHVVTMAAALATLDVVRSTTGRTAGLKWPNDVLAGPEERKVAGILSEAVIQGERVAVVVGLGLNVNWPAVLPDDLSLTATSLNHLAGRTLDRRAVLDRWLEALAHRSSSSSIVDDYRLECITVGRDVIVELPDGELRGRASAVDDDGRLVVTSRTGPQSIAAGDVVHVRSR